MFVSFKVGHNILDLTIVPSCSEGHKDEFEDEKGKSDEDESKDLSTSKGDQETLVDVFATHECSSGVGVDSDSHAKVSSEDGGSRSHKECDGSVWEVGFIFGSAHLLGINGEAEYNGKESGEDSKVEVFTG